MVCGHWVSLKIAHSDKILKIYSSLGLNNEAQRLCAAKVRVHFNFEIAQKSPNQKANYAICQYLLTKPWFCFHKFVYMHHKHIHPATADGFKHIPQLLPCKEPNDVIKERVNNKRQLLIDDLPLYLRSWIPLLEVLQACCKLYNISSLYHVMSCHVISWQIICVLYHRHQIGSMAHLPLFRLRSWSNVMRCMSFYILILYILISYPIIFCYIIFWQVLCVLTWGRWFVQTIAHRLPVYTGWAVLQHKWEATPHLLCIHSVSIWSSVTGRSA